MNAVSVSPNGAFIAAAATNGTITIWDTITGAQRHVLEGHEREVYAIAFSLAAPNVQLEDNLRATFGAEAELRIIELTATDEVTVNPRFDGVADTALLRGTDTLAPGARAVVTLVLEVAGVAGEFANQAVLSAATDGGERVARVKRTRFPPGPAG